MEKYSWWRIVNGSSREQSVYIYLPSVWWQYGNEMVVFWSNFKQSIEVNTTLRMEIFSRWGNVIGSLREQGAYNCQLCDSNMETRWLYFESIEKKSHTHTQIHKHTHTTDLKPLKCGHRINPVQHSKYHGCWCPGSLRRQDISTHDID